MVVKSGWEALVPKGLEAACKSIPITTEIATRVSQEPKSLLGKDIGLLEKPTETAQYPSPARPGRGLRGTK